jgi:hypothetical protein
LGNVNRESLLDIVNRFAENSVASAFCADDIAPVVGACITPNTHFYRSVDHACAASALLARVMEATTTPSSPGCEIHGIVACDFNLQAENSTRKRGLDDSV